MRVVAFLLAFLASIIFSGPASAQQQIACTAQVPVNILNSFSDYSPISSITPLTMRNFACSTPLAVPNIAQLRTNTVLPASINVLGATLAGDGGGAIYDYNPLDHTSSDNGSTIIVDAAGHRWYRATPTPSLFAGNVAALKSLTGAAATPGSTVTLQGYRIAGDMPSVAYVLSASGCTLNLGAGDGGSQYPSVGGGCWIITPQTVWDLRWWGAYGDVTLVNGTVTMDGSTCPVMVSGASFTSADKTKRITITDGISTANTANGPTYEGAIANVSGAANITVSPCPTFASGIAQDVHYGHDDVPAFLNAVAFLGTVYRPFTSGQPVLSGGGLNYGVYSAPANVTTNIALENIYLTALGAANLPLTVGVLGLNGSYSTGLNVTVDAGYLPVNAGYSTNNGTIWWNKVRLKNWLGHSVTPVVLTGATTTPGATFTGSIASCAGGSTSGFSCTLTVTGISFGAIKSGMSLYDATPTIPAGTYVQSYADNLTVGGIGTYTVYNATSSPVVGSETINGLGLDVPVTACSSANLLDVGLFSHGNASLGVPDRAVIVGCKSNQITLNKAPSKPLSNATLNFYQDANGLYMGSSAGLTITELTTNRDNFVAIAGNQYGCAVYDDSGGGSQLSHINLFQGAAGICLGTDAAGNDFRQVFQATNWGGAGICCELNAPSLLSMDGAQGTLLNDFNVAGQIQQFTVSSTSPISPQIALINPRLQLSTGSVLLAPSNNIWFYTEVANTSTLRIITSPYGVNNQAFSAASGQQKPSELIFTYGASGSWLEFTPQQINLLSQSLAVTLPMGSMQMNPGGIDLAMSPCNHCEIPQGQFFAAKLLSETDCGSWMVFSGTGYSVTVPRILGFNVSQALNHSACEIKMVANSSSGITLVPNTGASLFEAGSSTSSVTLTQNVPFILSCPLNTDGLTAICFVQKQSN